MLVGSQDGSYVNLLRTCTTRLYLGDARIELAIRDGGVLRMIEIRC